MKFIFYITILFFSVLLTSCQSTNKIYIVRHAEKSNEPANDPHLTTKGKQRTETLKNILKNKNIKAIFSTHTNRTIETALPLSQLINIPILYYSNDSLPDFMQGVVSNKKNVLIVGHSNTLVPMIVSIHLAHAILTIADGDYDNFFIIKVKGGKAINLTEKTYAIKF